MSKFPSDIAFSEAVKNIQAKKGSRQGYARMEEKSGWKTVINEELAMFIAARDSFYLGSANADGQPYIQHRGGPPGFLKVIDEKTLAFADFKGNRQYISSGNFSENSKAYIFLMDYPNRQRVKIWGTARVVEDPEQMAKLADADYGGIPEQAIFIDIVAWDANCPQHITPRYSKAEVIEIIQPFQQRIKALEAQIITLKGE